MNTDGLRANPLSSSARYHYHYTDVIIDAMASQITGVSIVCSTFGSCAGQRKHQSSASLAFVWRIHRWIPAQKVSNVENVSTWWRNHEYLRPSKRNPKSYWQRWYIGPLYTLWTGVLPQDLVKPRSREIGCYSKCITLKCERHLGSAVAELPIKYQRVSKSFNASVEASKLHDILR